MFFKIYSVRRMLLLMLLLVFNFISPTLATRYYVDIQLGNDLNNGLSASSAWQSLNKVNSFSFSPKDSILFARNGVWRGQLQPRSGSTLGYITYTDYGSGNKPLILGSKNKSSASNWIHAGGNIWKCSIAFTTDIGNMIFNGATLFGTKKWNLSYLQTQGDYHYNLNNGELKLYSQTNPALYYWRIECAQRFHIVFLEDVSYAVFSNLSIKYGAAHGFGGGNTHHVIIKGCDISYMGGGDLNMDGSSTRFGNGIEFWGNANNNLVEQCKIWEIYDSGVSNQNHTLPAHQYNIRYQNNIIYNCALASFEYWNKPSASTTSAIHFENNTCVNAGYGWGAQRPNRVGNHILLSYNEATTDSIFIRNNIFYNAHTCLALPASWQTSNGYQKLKLSNNCYYQPIATDTVIFLFHSLAYFNSSFELYQTQTGQDKGSFIADPLFVDYANNNFHITTNSPVINQGYQNGIQSDFDYEARTPPADIGADEYLPGTSGLEIIPEGHSFYISPNPTQEFLMIHSIIEDTTLPIDIYNASGSIIQSIRLKESVQLNISEWPAGIYFLKAKDKSERAVKVIKQ